MKLYSTGKHLVLDLVQLGEVVEARVSQASVAGWRPTASITGTLHLRTARDLLELLLRHDFVCAEAPRS